jgi:hypothetical protein
MNANKKVKLVAEFCQMFLSELPEDSKQTICDFHMICYDCPYNAYEREIDVPEVDKFVKENYVL